jgi:hypothetical protein
LIRHPEVRARIAGWVAYQPPHAGTVLSDLVQNSAELRPTGELVFGMLKGSSFTYQDMERGFRAGFNKTYRDEIERIPREFPIVTLVTSEEGASMDQYLHGDKSKVAFLAPFVGPIAANGGGLNDGIASFEGTCLDGATCAYVPGIDHFAAVMNTSPYKSITKSERITMFRTLLDMLAHRIRTTGTPDTPAQDAGALGLEVQEWLGGPFNWSGDARARSFAFHIMLNIADLDAYLKDPRHEAPLSGNVDVDGKKALAIVEGDAEFLVDARGPSDAKDTKLFLYRFVYFDPERGPVTFIGRKTAHNDRHGLDLWSDTTTIDFQLYAGRIAKGEQPTAAPIGRGTLHMKPARLVESIVNLRAPGKNIARSAKAVSEFGRLFFGDFWEIYGLR